MKIRTRIFLVFVFVVLTGFFFLIQWIINDLRPRYLESLEEPLVDTAHMLAEIITAEMVDDKVNSAWLDDIFEAIYERRFSAKIYALEKQQVDVRVYITDAKGVVIFDSQQRDVGKDYSRWNDVLKTLQGDYGARATNEDPRQPEKEVLYIAAPLVVGDNIVGVVSVGKPALNVERFLAVAKYKLAIAGLSAAIMVLLVGLGLYAWVSLPLKKLISYAQSVTAGERVSLPTLGNNEISLMGQAMEDIRQALEGKDYAQHYVQTLTHELKSPLAAIRGAAELLNEEMPVADRQRFLANIRNESERLQDLVDRMLELAALEKRRSLDKLEWIDINEIVQEAIVSLEPVAALKQLKITIKTQNQPPNLLQEKDKWKLRGERFLLSRALTNLLGNAIEFSPEQGEIIITIANENDNLRITLMDNGPGIPNYAVEKIFERFYSLQRPDTGIKGSGLGLSFVKEAVELHGGEVSLHNHAQGGAVASVLLPRVVSQ